MKKLFLVLILLCSCTYRVEETAICPQPKQAFKCISHDGSTVAICNTLDECNSICSKYNGK